MNWRRSIRNLRITVLLLQGGASIAAIAGTIVTIIYYLGKIYGWW